MCVCVCVLYTVITDVIRVYFRRFGLKFKELSTNKARRQDKMEGNKYRATYFPRVKFIFITLIGLDIDLFAIC